MEKNEKKSVSYTMNVVHQDHYSSPTILQRTVPFIPFFTIFGLILFPMGIAFMCVSSSHLEEVCSQPLAIVIDYTNCTDKDISETEQSCRETMLKSNRTCKCFVELNLTTDLLGDVALYYELETFNKSKTADYFQSRDDAQLRGELALNVSEKCGEFSYGDDGKPIAPCGAIADALFTDAFDLIHPEVHFVPIALDGMIAEEHKKKFRNPVPHDDLSVAFQNFSKPKSWRRNIWQLDELYPNNNGFENIVFIGWMTTEWKRKPMWRIDRTKNSIFKNGLPAGEYELGIEYNYSPHLYDGPRKVILAKPFSYSNDPECTTIIHENWSKFKIGLVALLIGIILLILTAVLLIAVKQGKVYTHVFNPALTRHQ